MPIELKNVFDYIGLNEADVENEDKFRELFDEKFTQKSNVDDKTKASIVGAAAGATTVKATQLMKQHGVEGIDLKGKRLEEVVETAITEVAKKYSTELETLKSTAGKPDERVSVLETDLEKYKKLAAEEKTQRENAVTQLEKFRSDATVEKQTLTLNFLLKDKNEKTIKFNTSVKDVEKKGYFAHLNEKYNFELSEDGSDIIPTTKKGDRIPNPKAHGTFLTYEDILKNEGVELGVWEMNPHGGKTTPPQSKTTIITPPSSGTVRPIAQRVIPAAR
jgi:DNA repair ATPase RecN